MNCPFCNQQLPDGSLFCGFCGNKITEEAMAASGNAAQGGAAAPAANVLPPMVNAADPGANAQAPKSGAKFGDQVKDLFGKVTAAVKNDSQQAVQAVKTRSFKELLKNKSLIICCAAVIAIILIVIIACNLAPHDSRSQSALTYYFAKDDSETTILYKGNVVKGEDFTLNATFLASSSDKSVLLVKDEENLYILDNGKADLITDEFDSESVCISMNGKTVAYVSDGTMYVYKGGKSKKLKDLESDTFPKPAVSPDGKVVAFSDFEDDDIVTYAWKGGKVIDLEADIIPLLVSNGGKVIYGHNNSLELCTILNFKKDSAEDFSDPRSYVVGVSKDHSKIVYHNGENTYYYQPSFADDEGTRVKKGIITTLEHYTLGGFSWIDDISDFYAHESHSVYRCYRKGKEYEAEKLYSYDGGQKLSDDRKSFVFIDDDGDLMKGSTSNAKNAKKVGKDAVSVKANGSLSCIYYVDDDGNLRYAGKDGKIASDIDKYIVTDGGVCVFSDTEGDLYYSVKGGSKKKTSIDEVSNLAMMDGVLYITADGTLYISKDGKSFKKTNIDVV